LEGSWFYDPLERRNSCTLAKSSLLKALGLGGTCVNNYTIILLINLIVVDGDDDIR
jgi:hypothetical protein